MERNEYTGVISIFLRRLEEGQPFVIYGDGMQVRDFVYVDDVVQANLGAAVKGRPGAVYNIGIGPGHDGARAGHAADGADRAAGRDRASPTSERVKSDRARRISRGRGSPLISFPNTTCGKA